MEVVLDKHVAYVAAGIIGLVILGCLAYGVMLIGQALVPAPPKYNYTAQMEFMNWTICQQTDAMQMYLQNPASSRPSVIALRQDIQLYNGMANELRKSGETISNFTRCS